MQTQCGPLHDDGSQISKADRAVSGATDFFHAISGYGPWQKSLVLN